MNKVFKLIWNTSLGQWVVCSELGKKSKSSTKATILIGGILMSSAGFAAECNKGANGSVTVNNQTNTGANFNCEVSNIASEVGNNRAFDYGLYVFAQGADKSITVTNDLTTTVKGSTGIIVSRNDSGFTSSFNAADKTIDITIDTIDANASNPNGDNIPKSGLVVEKATTATIGTLNLTMKDLPNGNSFEHYGVLAGSSVNSGGLPEFNGVQAKAIIDNLNIEMSADNKSSDTTFPLLVGIRAIQGPSRSRPGIGSAGYVQVNDNLNINIDSKDNDAIGIYVSGTEKNGVSSEVRLNNSNITIDSISSNRANAIRLGKKGPVGTGKGKLYSTGNMNIDTTKVLNDAAIDIIWQGSLLEADAATASTTIKAGREAITVDGDASESTEQTVTSFNNLVINQTATNTANLIDIAGNQADYVFTAKGDQTLLIANTGNDAYLINVQGATATPSKVTFNLANGDMQGLVNTTDASTLNLNLSDGATWQLANNGNSSQATFTTLNLASANLIAHDSNKGDSFADQSTSNFDLRGNVVANNSQIDMKNGVAGDQLTINGNYTTGGNTWLMDSFLTGEGQSTNLGADGRSYTDKVRITGNVTGQNADLVRISNLNMANPTGKESILLYEIEGDSDGKFLLDGRVARGGYEYLLNQQANGNWNLESVDAQAESGNDNPVMRPEVGSYLANAQSANNLFTHRLEDRVGASEYTNMNQDNVGQLWLRAVGGKSQFNDNTSQVETDSDRYLIHGGVGLASFGLNDEYNVGVMAAYGKADSDSESSVTGFDSSSKVDGYGYGVYGTWFEQPNTKTGAYADAWVMWNEFDNEVSGQGMQTENYDSSGLTASIEAGSNYQIGQSATGTSYWLQPQAQFIYQDVQLDEFVEQSNTRVEEGKANIQTRLGAKASMIVPTSLSTNSNYRPYAAINWIHNSNGEDKAIRLDNSYYGVGGAKDIGEIKLGLEGQTSTQSNAWVNVAYQVGSEDYRDLTGTIGFKVNF